MSDRQSATVFPLLLACLALAGGLLGTRWGVGIQPDSLSYLNLEGQGAGAYGFGPLYTWVIALFSTPADVLDRARWLSVGLLTLNVLLVWYVLRRSVRSALPAFLGALLVLGSRQTLHAHLYAQSEGLFIFFVLLALLALARHLETGRMLFFLMAGLSMGAATLTRFAGIPLIAVGFLAMVFLSRAPWRARLVRATGLGALGGAPLGAWALYSALAKGSSGTGRELAFLGNADAARFLQGAHELVNLLVPSGLPPQAELAILALAVIVLVHLTLRYTRERVIPNRTGRWEAFALLPPVLALFIPLYLAFLLLSVLIEANLPLYWRYMVPVYVAVVPLAVMLAHHALGAGRGLRPSRRAVTALLLLGLVLTNAARGGKWVLDAYHEGLGYASAAWRHSPIVAEIRKLDPAVPIYTNGVDAIRFHTGRAAQGIPAKLVRRTGKAPTDSPQAQLEAMRDDLERNGAVVVFFDKIHWRFYLVTEDELLAELPLSPIASVADGRIYAWAAH